VPCVFSLIKTRRGVYWIDASLFLGNLPPLNTVCPLTAGEDVVAKTRKATYTQLAENMSIGPVGCFCLTSSNDVAAGNLAPESKPTVHKREN